MKTTIILVALVILTTTSSASAAPITVPTDLNVGDSYRLAFVTSTTRTATSSNIANYNSFVSGVANTVTELAALGTTWTAIGSTKDDDARDNTGTNPNVSTGVPVYILDDRRIANDNAELWDCCLLSNYSLITQEDGTFREVTVWTGTMRGGTHWPGNSLGDDLPFFGLSTTGSSSWLTGGRYLPNTRRKALYAMSGQLTVVPEPTTYTLALAALCLAMSRRRSH